METKGSEKEMSETKQKETIKFSDASVKEMCIREVKDMCSWDDEKVIVIDNFRSIREKTSFPYYYVDVRINDVVTLYLEDIKNSHFSYIISSKHGFIFKYVLSIDDLKDMI